MNALVKREPFDIFDLFGGFFGPPRKFLDEDIQETDEAWIVSIDMPGMEVSVQLDGSTLSLSGERRLRSEMDRIGRSFTLPSTADKEKISAAYENGVLVVTIPKRAPPEKQAPKSIEVKLK